MMLFGYRLPMMSSLLVWCLIWEIVGQLDLMFLIPPLSSVFVRDGGTGSDAPVPDRHRRHAAKLRRRHGAGHRRRAWRWAC